MLRKRELGVPRRDEYFPGRQKAREYMASCRSCNDRELDAKAYEHGYHEDGDKELERSKTFQGAIGPVEEEDE